MMAAHPQFVDFSWTGVHESSHLRTISNESAFGYVPSHGANRGSKPRGDAKLQSQVRSQHSLRDPRKLGVSAQNTLRPDSSRIDPLIPGKSRESPFGFVDFSWIPRLILFGVAR
jgi:hypothetical protein